MNEENVGQTKDPFKEECFQIRATIEAIKMEVNRIKSHQLISDSGADMGEVKANIQLAFRALEDARMRIGKAIQAYDGGQSCYPK